MRLLEYSNPANADILYIRLSEERIDHTEERGPLLVDVNANGNAVGVEILDIGELLDSLRGGAIFDAELVEE